MVCVSSLLERFEKEKVYTFDREGLAKMQMDIKSDKIAKFTSFTVYAILAYFIISGRLGTDFIFTYVAGMTSSKTVKALMKDK